MTDEFYNLLLKGMKDTASVTTSPVMIYEGIIKTLDEEQRIADLGCLWTRYLLSL